MSGTPLKMFATNEKSLIVAKGAPIPIIEKTLVSRNDFYDIRNQIK